MKIQRYITSVERDCDECGDIIPVGALYARLKPGEPTLCKDCVVEAEGYIRGWQ